MRVRAGITGIIEAGAVYHQGKRHRCAVGSGGCTLLWCCTAGSGGGSRGRPPTQGGDKRGVALPPPVPRHPFVDGLERGIAHSARAGVKGGPALLRCYAVGRGGRSRVRAGVTGIIKIGEGVIGRGGGSVVQVRVGITGIIKAGQGRRHRCAEVKGFALLLYSVHGRGRGFRGRPPTQGSKKGHNKTSFGLWEDGKGWYRGVGEQLEVFLAVDINGSLHPRNKCLSQCCRLPRGRSPRSARQSWL